MQIFRFYLKSTTNRAFYCKKLLISEETLGVTVTDLVLLKHFSKRNQLVLRILLNDQFMVKIFIKNLKFVDKAEIVVHLGSWRLIVDKKSEGGVTVRSGRAGPEGSNEYADVKYRLFDEKFMGVLWKKNEGFGGLTSGDDGYKSDDNIAKPPVSELYL